MDIYDDLERFKQQIQQNTFFHQFEASRGYEMTNSNYAIFHQLDDHYSALTQGHAHMDSMNRVETDISTSSDLEIVANRVTDKASETSIFESVSKISSKQSLERLLQSTGLSSESESSLAFARSE